MSESFQITSDCQDIKQCLIGAASYIEERFSRSIAINGTITPVEPKPVKVKRPIRKPSGSHASGTDSARAKLASQ